MRHGMTAFGLSLMPEPGFARATLPLFADGLIDAVEWSFDMGWHPAGIGGWLESLLTDYSNQGLLIGHGVSYSLLGAAGFHDRWLSLLRSETAKRDYYWISEHVGFVGAGRFSFSAPLPMPADADVVALGQKRIIDLADAAGCDVGLENLATCLGSADATDQGSFLRQLLAPVDGFVLLDLHNLYCQGHNVGIDPLRLMAQLPLDRVREVHVSGGRWSVASNSARKIRRDTHDSLVPDAVLDLLGVALMRCPNLEVVIYERMGSTFGDPAIDADFRNDVQKVAAIVASVPPSLPHPAAPLGAADFQSENHPGDGQRDLAGYQASLLEILSEPADGPQIKDSLASTEPAWADRIDRFDNDLLEVASTLTRTWGRLVTS